MSRLHPRSLVLSAAIYDVRSRLPSMPKSCEVVEIRNSADAVGYPCSRTTSKECSDCGIALCEDHAEPCGTCFSIFCPPCRFLHRGQHSKPAHGGQDTLALVRLLQKLRL